MSSNYPQSPKPTKLMAKIKLTTTNESPNEDDIINYILAYKLQRNSENKRFFFYINNFF